MAEIQISLEGGGIERASKSSVIAVEIKIRLPSESNATRADASHKTRTVLGERDNGQNNDSKLHPNTAPRVGELRHRLSEEGSIPTILNRQEDWGATIVIYPEPTPGSLLVTFASSLQLHETLATIYQHSYHKNTYHSHAACKITAENSTAGKGTRGSIESDQRGTNNWQSEGGTLLDTSVYTRVLEQLAISAAFQGLAFDSDNCQSPEARRYCEGASMNNNGTNSSPKSDINYARGTYESNSIKDSEHPRLRKRRKTVANEKVNNIASERKCASENEKSDDDRESTNRLDKDCHPDYESGRVWVLRMWYAFALCIHPAVMVLRRIACYTPHGRVPSPDQVFLTVRFMCMRGRRLLLWPLVYASMCTKLPKRSEILRNKHTHKGMQDYEQRHEGLHHKQQNRACTGTHSLRQEEQEYTQGQQTLHAADRGENTDRIDPGYTSRHTNHIHNHLYTSKYYSTQDRSECSYQTQITHRAMALAMWDEVFCSAVDTLFGLIVGVVLWKYAVTLTDTLVRVVREYSIEYVIHTIRWLAESPGGVKLNPPVAKFLGMVFEVYAGWWGAALASVEMHLHLVIRAGIVLLSPGGLVLLVSGLVDLVYVLTFHIYLLGRFSTNLYGGVIRCLISTSRLFRGYKRNVLRLRIDSCHLAYDQLLVNTMFFTTLFFTVPTVTIYYAFFLGCKAVGMGVYIGTHAVCVFLCQFPLYSIRALLCAPDSIPGGLMIAPVLPDPGLASATELQRTQSTSNPLSGERRAMDGYRHVGILDTTVLKVRNRTVGVATLFARAHNAVVSVLAPYQMGEILSQIMYGYLDPKESAEGTDSDHNSSAREEDEWAMVADYSDYERKLTCACVLSE